MKNYWAKVTALPMATFNMILGIILFYQYGRFEEKNIWVTVVSYLFIIVVSIFFFASVINVMRRYLMNKKNK
ncbi:hypothetical protein DES38_11058 [Streptohalobacillus salinus]|uniref:Uncharacterized protein n=1 Tax=Streptohalobacillus salinus TaxID=621096 RepID=A0A2V3W4H0_9BACI|nr:hypothetical protein [Streptohalobacillus salinus]PXW89197.1 hypothetical protein DES38_11058 [Streptohalobacillus salinus]